MLRKFIKAEYGAVLAAAAVLGWLLFAKPVVGMADNGDFLRIMGTVGLQYTDNGLTYGQKYFGWFIREFAISEVGLGGYVSTSLVLVFLAKGLSWLLLDGGRFDMRLLALVYGLLFLTGAWLAIKYNKRRSAWVNGLAALLFVLIFTDIGYAAYYNSLYSEPVSLVFLILSMGFATGLLRRGQPMKLFLAGFVVSSVFLIGSKVQNAPIGILLALLCLRFSALRGGGWRKLTCSMAILLFAASVAIYVSLPKELRIINQYQTVFFGILKDSPTVEQDLRELGLPEKFAVNAGTNYFDKAAINQKDPVFANEFYPVFSHGKVIKFYLNHPMRLYEKLEVAAGNGMNNRPPYLGGFEQSEGFRAGELPDAFNLWNKFKLEVLPNKLWFIAAVFAAYYLVLARRYLESFQIRQRLYLEVLAAIGLGALILFVTPVIGDGEADLVKHLFGFNICFDLMLWISAFWLLEGLQRTGAALRLRKTWRK
ncbi:MAG: rane protein [Paenibacillaceae bacterium]|jgi:hypothetical protein|nr:rane protein [Paenibacillaceae bacterium]